MSILVPIPSGAPPDLPAGSSSPTAAARPDSPALAILRDGQHAGRLIHVEHIPARTATSVPWPEWAPELLTSAFARNGIRAPWSHQADTASHAHAGRNVIVATAAASGKSVGYLLPALSAVLGGGTVLYITPTKALAADQLAAITALGIPGIRAATLDGDSTAGERAWARAHAGYLLTNPDMLHHVLLPQHARWSGFFRRLRYVIVDECHGYRGVFGSHVGHVLRRLRRIAEYHATLAPALGSGLVPGGTTAASGTTSDPGRPPSPQDSGTTSLVQADAASVRRPVFILASATVSEPGACARLLTGLDAEEVTHDASPRGPVAFALWEPPLTSLRGEAGAPVRRPATVEAADLLARLVREKVPTLAFIRSRRGAEAVALAAKKSLAAPPPNGNTRTSAGPVSALPDGDADRVAAYRSGYLPEDRRRLEAALRDGRLTGLATTTALELGVNITGLDAVLIAGWPGTWASLWQQAGRAGRSGQSAVAVLIARDDPLDTYLVHHPETLLRHPVEATVLDPANPYVLAPHLCAAAAELPLTDADLKLFGSAAPAVADDLTHAGLLRKRPSGWYWTRRDRAHRLTSLRGAGADPVRVVEASTGRLIGTIDEPSAHAQAHTGAVYLHQGETFLVNKLDLADGVALVDAAEPGYTTTAREVTEIDVIGELRHLTCGEADIRFGDVTVTRQVVSYTRRRHDTGKTSSETPLDLPARTLRTRAVWWTISPAQRSRLISRGIDLLGAAHAAEHASIGLLPLFATCDRWDIGGVSADLHPATGQLTVFVYDGHDGGAGFAERGFSAARDWLSATRHAIANCECDSGCPSCIQSPKCGSNNTPLSKPGAQTLLTTLLEHQAP